MAPVAHVGLRRGEAAGIEWGDVDLTGGSLRVHRQLVQVGWEGIESAPKSDAGDRTIALDTGTAAVLRDHRKRQMAERMEWASAWTETGKVSFGRTVRRCTRRPPPKIRTWYRFPRTESR